MSISISYADRGMQKDSSGWYQKFEITISVTSSEEANYFTPGIFFDTESGVSHTKYHNGWYRQSDWVWIGAGSSHTFTIKFYPPKSAQKSWLYFRVYCVQSDTGSGDGYFTTYSTEHSDGAGGIVMQWHYLRIDQGSFYWQIPILPWRWSNSSGSWNQQDGKSGNGTLQLAYNALTYGGKTTQFSYLVWNDLVRWVLDILDKTGSMPSSYYDPSMDPNDNTDRILTARKWGHLKTLCDAAANALGGSINMPSVTAYETKVTGTLFFNFINGLNNLIQ